MSHFSHPPLQVYRRCRLKKLFANYDYFGLSAEDKCALYKPRQPARLRADGDTAETQSSRVVLSACFRKGWAPKKPHFQVLGNSGKY